MVIYHYGHYGRGTDVGPWLALITEFGFLGVQLFFMISGFVILWTAMNKSSLEFVVSRVSRLYPTFWVCVLLTAATRFALDYSVTISQLLANLTMLPGALRQMPLDDVYWTLVIEIKFYAIILCLLLARQLPSIRRWLAFWLAISVLAAIYPRWLHMAAFDQFSAYFIGGCYLYLLRTQFSTGLLIPFAICAALGVHNAIAIQSQFTHDDSPQADLWAGIFMIAEYTVFLGISLRRIRLPAIPLWGWLGAMTYPLYLSHAGTVGNLGMRYLQETPARFAIMMGTALLLAGTLAAVIERKGCVALNRRLLYWLNRPGSRAMSRTDSARE